MICPILPSVPESIDQLNRRILKELISPGSIRWDVREPYSRIARRLAVDEETVRRRLTRLREDGIIGKFVLFLNPRLLDRENGVLYLESKEDASISQAIPKLRLVDGIVSLTSVHEGGLLVGTYHQGEASLARLVALTESMCNARTAMQWTAPYPSYSGRLTKTDWIILGGLLKDPRRKLSDLARDLGISTRTVNRRVKRLSEGNAMFLFLEFDLTKIVGLRYLLLVHGKDEELKREADRTILSRLPNLFYSETWAPNHSVFVFACDNILEAETISRWVKETKGVTQTRLGIIRGRVHNLDWVEEEIQRRIAGGS